MNLFQDNKYSQFIHDKLIPIYEFHPEIFLMVDEEKKFLMDYVEPDQESFFNPSFIQQFKRYPLSSVRLHLCGNGNAGKTTLLRTLKQGRVEGFGKRILGLGRRDPGRTVGVEISRLELEGREFSVFDYGGQKEFHTTHDRFFEGSASVFVIVVSLVDELGELRIVEEILEEIGYWNRFVNSCCEEGEILILIRFDFNLIFRISGDDNSL